MFAFSSFPRLRLFLRRDLHRNLVPPVQPAAQVHQLATLGTKRKPSRNLFPLNFLDRFPANGTLHEQILRRSSHRCTPLAVAFPRRHHRQLISPVHRAMLAWRFGLVPRRASAAISQRVAIHHLQKWRPAIRNAAPNHTHRAGFADGRPRCPILRDPPRTNTAQPCGCRLGHRHGDRSKRTAAAGEASHGDIIGRLI